MPGIVAVTATRRGLTVEQEQAFEGVLYELATLGYDALVHGDCVGGDEKAALIARKMGFTLVARPWDSERWCAHTESHVRHEPDPDPLRRDRKVVDDGAVLVGMPHERAEPKPARGQGTWSTVRYARKQAKPVILIWPSGKITEERWPE